jgi:hypothetical protein
MSLREKVMTEGMRLAQHPALAPLVQDERFLKLVMAALSVPGRLEELTEEQRQTFMRVMGVASAREVADLRRSVRSLEDEVTRLRQELEGLRRERG